MFHFFRWTIEQKCYWCEFSTNERKGRGGERNNLSPLWLIKQGYLSQARGSHLLEKVSGRWQIDNTFMKGAPLSLDCSSCSMKQDDLAQKEVQLGLKAMASVFHWCKNSPSTVNSRQLTYYMWYGVILHNQLWS